LSAEWKRGSRVYLSSLIREAYGKNGVVVAYVYGNMGYSF
jgi:hypothetical protein